MDAEPTWATCVTSALPTEMWVCAHICPSAPFALVSTPAAPGEGEGQFSGAGASSPTRDSPRPQNASCTQLTGFLGPSAKQVRPFPELGRKSEAAFQVETGCWRGRGGHARGQGSCLRCCSWFCFRKRGVQAAVCPSQQRGCVTPAPATEPFLATLPVAQETGQTCCPQIEAH